MFAKKIIFPYLVSLAIITLMITIKSFHYTTNQQINNSTKQLIQIDDTPLNFTNSDNNLQFVCKTFDFIPSEWTLIWRNTSKLFLENKKCFQLYSSAFKSKQVKAVIYPNKTIEYLGCTKNTHWCNPAAHFDKKLNVRINTPPCCQQKMLFMLKILTAGFQRLGIPHMLFGGAAIGWVRNGKMIPYDEDLDMLVNGSYWRSKPMMKFLDDIVKKHGFYISWRAWAKSETFGIQYSRTNENGFGIWSYRLLKNGKIHYVWSSNPAFDYETLNPPKLVNFNGVMTYVPNNPVKYMDEEYGKGRWRKEVMCKKINADRKCVDY